MNRVLAHYIESEPPEHMLNMRLGEEMDLTPRQDGGVFKKVLQEGEGDFYANLDDKITLRYIAYVGQVDDEHIFDSSENDGKDFVFTMLKGQVVKGFEIAVMTMKQGERAMIKLDPNYAFGKAGAPPRIPADTPVFFDTHILKLEAEDLSPDGDASMTKHTLIKGRGWAAPNDGCWIDIHMTGWHEGRQFVDRDVQWILGEGIDPLNNVPEFIEDMLYEFKKDEIAELKVAAKHAYGDKGCPMYDIPPGADLVYHVKLNEFEKAKDIWTMDGQERLNQCLQYKNKGNEFFKRKQWELARKFYYRMVDTLEFDMLLSGEEEARRKQHLMAAYCNLAQAYLKEENYLDTKRYCDKVLEEEPDNIKALYRRAMAYYFTKDYEIALQGFERVLELEPGNKVARRYRILCEKRASDASGSEREMYQRMFTSSDNSSESERPSSGMDDIGDWDNSMAHGMMTLEQEAMAWDDVPPPKGDNNHGNH